MDWQNSLANWIGNQVTVTIEDQAGPDPVSPPRSFVLIRLRLTEEKTHLQFFLNDNQFVSVPIFTDGRTRLIEQEFVSEDVKAKLIYMIHQ